MYSTHVAKSLPTLPLSEIKLRPVRGNAHSDRFLLHDLDVFILDATQTTAERIEALDYLGNVVMGLDELPNDEASLREYVECGS